MSELQAHIRLGSDLGIRAALLPGDPKRLDRIAPYLENVRELAYNREFRSLAGTYRGLEIIALSTGIGGASAAIAVEELHNIGVKAMIRIGSCGALQEGIKLGELIVSSGAVREDGASKMYVSPEFPAVPDTRLLMAVLNAADGHSFPYRVGITRSHDSFYTDSEEEYHNKWSKLGVIGSDMETAALFTVGALRSIMTASILNNVVECGEGTAESIGGFVDGEELTAKGEANSIVTALDALYSVRGLLG